MDEIKRWLDQFDYNKPFDYTSFLLIRDRNYELDFTGYIKIDIDNGNQLYNMIDKCLKTTIVLGNIKKLIYIDGVVAFDKGVVVGIKNILKQDYKHSVPIIVDMIDDKNIDRIFHRRYKIIGEVKQEIKIMPKVTAKHKIEIYKRRLFIDCFLEQHNK